jgi:hypothetical protein
VGWGVDLCGGDRRPSFQLKRSFATKFWTDENLSVMLSRMSRKQLEALGYTFVESDLPAIVREWCVGDSVLCLVRGEFDYFENEVWKRLKPFPIEECWRATGSLRD